MITIKKYSNRRLYDTSESRYVTLDELAERIRAGNDAKVVDASSGDDITQSTLAQIVMESRGASKMLPVPLLTEMIRMGDDALAEFLGNYLAMALHLYTQARRGAQAANPYNPWLGVPFAATDAMARAFSQMPWVPASPYGNPWAQSPYQSPPPGYAPAPPAVAPPPPTDTAEQPETPPGPTTANEIAALRSELEALKEAVKGKPE